MIDKKPRSDSKLDALAPEHKHALTEMLVRNERYVSILQWLQDECGVESSLAALSAYNKRVVAPLIAEQRKLAVQRAEMVIAEADGFDWDAASSELLRQTVFGLMCNPNADQEQITNMFRLLLAHQKNQTESRRLALLEEKNAAAKKMLEAAAKNKTGDNALTPEALALIEQAAGLL